MSFSLCWMSPFLNDPCTGEVIFSCSAEPSAGDDPGSGLRPRPRPVKVQAAGIVPVGHGTAFLAGRKGSQHRAVEAPWLQWPGHERVPEATGCPVHARLEAWRAEHSWASAHCRCQPGVTRSRLQFVGAMETVEESALLALQTVEDGAGGTRPSRAVCKQMLCRCAIQTGP